MHGSLIGVMCFETFKLLTGVPLLPNSLKVWHLRVFSDNVILTRLRAVKVAFWIYYLVFAKKHWYSKVLCLSKSLKSLEDYKIRFHNWLCGTIDIN